MNITQPRFGVLAPDLHMRRNLFKEYQGQTFDTLLGELETWNETYRTQPFPGIKVRMEVLNALLAKQLNRWKKRKFEQGVQKLNTSSYRVESDSPVGQVLIKKMLQG
jgi:hypothetical protein